MLLSLLFASVLAGIVTFTNPILHSDYSDPDVIQVDGEYWMTASSFNCVPGLQVLHSYDLVNWEIVGAALPEMDYDIPPEYRLRESSTYDSPRPGRGVWAPSIRWHEGVFYIFWGDPDVGIFQVHARDPRGVWSEPEAVILGKGLIDPCPLWDDDGRVYLVHGWAGSRAGFKSVLSVCELDSESLHCRGGQVLVFDGNKTGNKTVEGPKFYKRGGYYYIFAPAGGVREGWQLVLRSGSVFGPYEYRTVMHQGGTPIHGPHQGALVEDAGGASWFLHFEDRRAWGRVCHLQPVEWDSEGWCIIGRDNDGDGIGEPVSKCDCPAVMRVGEHTGPEALGTGTDFTGVSIPLNWQWVCNPQVGWAMMNPADSTLRMNCIPKNDKWGNLWDTPNLLLEKIAGPEMEFTAKLSFRPSNDGDRVGLVVMGKDYFTLELDYDGNAVSLVRRNCIGASTAVSESIVTSVGIAAEDRSKARAARLEKALTGLRSPIARKTRSQMEKESARMDQTGGDIFYSCWVRVNIRTVPTSTTAYGMKCSFSYSTNGSFFRKIGGEEYCTEGIWIGAKLGFFAISDVRSNDSGYLEVK